jgi:hypothetical protein
MVAAGRTVAAARTAGGRAAIMAEVCNVTFSPGRISQRADRMAAPGLTEPRDASERGLAMGGERPTERRFTVGGSGKSVARCHRTVLAYWKFESIPLQRSHANFSVPGETPTLIMGTTLVWLASDTPALPQHRNSLLMTLTGETLPALAFERWCRLRQDDLIPSRF